MTIHQHEDPLCRDNTNLLCHQANMKYIPSYWEYLLDDDGNWYYHNKEDPRPVDESSLKTVSGQKRKVEDSSSD